MTPRDYGGNVGKVFVSFHEPDAGPFVGRLVAALEEAGYSDYYDYRARGHAAAPGEPWAANIRKNLLLSQAFIAVSSEGSGNDWCINEVSVFRERKPTAPYLEIVLGAAARRALTADIQSLSADPDDADSVADVVADAVRFLRDRGVPTGPGPTSPYPGLAAFGEATSSLFFGRREAIDELVADIAPRDHGVLAVVGASGVGKSSLVRAGLIPRLRAAPSQRAGRWLILGPVSPNTGAVRGLAEQLARLRDSAGLPPVPASVLEGRLRQSPSGLAELIAELIDVNDGQHGRARVLIVLDQAEELLDQHESGRDSRPGQRTEARALVDALVAASRRVAWLVYTVRADYLEPLLRDTGLKGLIQRSFLVRPLTGGALVAAIADPARQLGWDFDSEALGAIVEDAGRGSLPMLAYALAELWDRVDTGDATAPRAIKLGEYVNSGRVPEVLARQAEAAFQEALELAVYGTSISPDLVVDLAAAENEVLELLTRLASVGRDRAFTRRPLLIDEISGDRLRLLRPFLARRVLTTTRSLFVSDDAEGRVDEVAERVLGIRNVGDNALEVAHESLFSGWPRLHRHLVRLRESLRARGELEDLAAIWRSGGRQDTDLINQSRLQRLLADLTRTDRLEAATGWAAWGWPALRTALAAGDVTPEASRLVAASAQYGLDRLVGEAEVLAERSLEDSLRLLVGAARNTDPASLAVVLSAPRLEAWRALVQRVEARMRWVRRLRDGGSGMWGVAWSPDDSRAVTGSRDGRPRVWDPERGQLVMVFSHGEDQLEAGGGWVRAVAWHPDGDQIASASTDQTVRLWSTASEREVRVIALTDRPWSLRFSPDGALVVAACANGETLLRPARRPYKGASMILRATSRGGVDGGPVVRLWDVDVCAGPADRPAGALRVATARQDGLIDLWTVEPEANPDGTDTPTRQIEAHAGSVARAVRFAPDGRTIATGAQDNLVKVIDVTDGSEVRQFSGHTDQVRRVAWSPRGNRLASASADTTVGVWDVHTGERLLVLRGHRQGVCDVAWSKAGDRVMSVADDGTALVWKIGAVETATADLGTPATAMDWTAASAYFAIARTPGASTPDSLSSGTGGFGIDIRRPDGSRVAWTPRAHEAIIQSISWSPSGERLLTGSRDETARIWRLRGDRLELEHTLPVREGVEDGRWSPDGTRLLTAARDRMVRLYRSDGTSLDREERRPHESFLRGLAWHPHGVEYALVAEDNRLTLNSADAVVAHFDAGRRLTSVAWSPTGDRLAVGSTDGEVLVLAVGTSQEVTELHRLAGHTDEIHSVAWSYDGRSILTASADRTAAVWDASTGAQTTALVGSAGGVVQALWTDGPHTVATASADGTLRHWDVSDAGRDPLSGPPADADGHGANATELLVQDGRLRLG